MSTESLGARLPDELWLHILSFVDPKTLISMQSVDNRQRTLASDHTLWSALLKRPEFALLQTFDPCAQALFSRAFQAAKQIATLVPEKIYSYPASENQQPAGPSLMTVLYPSLFIPDDHATICISLETKKVSILPLYEPTDEEPASDIISGNDRITPLLTTAGFKVMQRARGRPTQAFSEDLDYVPEDLKAYDRKSRLRIKVFTHVEEHKWIKKVCLVHGILFGLSYHGTLFAWDTISQKMIRKIHFVDETIVDMTASKSKLIIKTFIRENRGSYPIEDEPALNTIQQIDFTLQ